MIEYPCIDDGEDESLVRTPLHSVALSDDSNDESSRTSFKGKALLSEGYDEVDQSEDELTKFEKQSVPNMWSWNYIGLYAQYAAVGLIFGSTGTLLPFCVYTFDGASNVCANAKNITTFAWNVKIFFAIITDTYRPFGKRRVPWMIAGWSMVLVLLLILACAVQYMSITVWLVTLLFVQCFLMLSDVPADGYSVELGKLESKAQRGQILATGQRVRYAFCMVAGLIQTFLLNGPTTNDSDCDVSFENCWSWGLNINQYYGLLFALVFILTFPVWFLKELDSTHIPLHTFSHFCHEVWLTLQNLTTFYLLTFVCGTYVFTNFINNANIYLQYYVIKLTNFQAGIDTMTTYGALVGAIWVFQRYLIRKNWRYSQYGSTLFSSALNLVWIPAYYNLGGTMNPWYTIFIDMDNYFVQGISRVIYSMAVIELAKPGQEATTFELIVTVGNSAQHLGAIISTQLLTPMQAVGCDDDSGGCSSNTVIVTSKDSFDSSDGPARFTHYTLLLTGISIAGCLLFTQFLPSSKEECHEWKRKGDLMGTSERRGWASLLITFVIIGYGVVVSVLLLDVDTACLPAIGGSGC